MVEVDVTGLDEATETLEQIAARLGDMTPIMQSVAAEILTFAGHRFDTRTSPGGQPWVPTKRPSRDRGTMRASVFAVGQASGVSFGAGADWSDEHQFGTPRMPARPFLPTSQFRSGPAAELWKRVARMVARWVSLHEAELAAAQDDGGFGDFNF